MKDQPAGEGPAPSQLFTPFRLRGLALANRIVVSPMCQYSAQNGSMVDWHMMHLGALANSGAGLLMVEATGVAPEGRITHGCTGLYSDDNERSMQRVVDACRRYGTAKIGIQIGHAGRKASAKRPWESKAHSDPLEGDGEPAWPTKSASGLPTAPGWPTPEPMTLADIARLESDVVQATRRADRIGFELLIAPVTRHHRCYRRVGRVGDRARAGQDRADETRDVAHLRETRAVLRVPLRHVRDLVTDHRRELIFAFEERDEPTVHEDVSPGHRERVDPGGIDQREVDLHAGLARVRDEAISHTLQVVLPRLVGINLIALDELLIHLLADARGEHGGAERHRQTDDDNGSDTNGVHRASLSPLVRGASGTADA